MALFRPKRKYYGRAATTTTIAYTLTAVSGTYNITGNAVLFPRAHTLTAVSGTYNITGNAVNLKVGHTLTAVKGTYNITGNAALFPITHKLTAVSGTYNITGNAVNLKVGHTITATAGTYALTGNAVLFSTGRKLTAVAGSYAITGRTVNLLRAYTMAAVSGVYNLTGNAISFLLGKGFAATSGVYTLTGNPATLTVTAVPVTDTPHDVFAPTEELRKKFKLPGEVKRKRLTKSIIKQIKNAATTPPSLETITKLGQAAIPNAGENDIAHLSMDILAQIEVMSRSLAAEKFIKEVEERKAEEQRRQIIIEQVARYMQMIEDDEILLMHII